MSRPRDHARGLVLGAMLARIDGLERRAVVGERRAVVAEGRERGLLERIDSQAASLNLVWRKLDSLERASRRPGLVETQTLADATAPRRVPAVAAARRLGVAPRTVRRLIEAGDLEGLALPMPDSTRRVWVVELGSLERLERESGAPGAVGAASAADRSFSRPSRR